MRLIDPLFGAAVRWAVFVERLSEGLAEERSAAKADPEGLSGSKLTEFLGARSQIREHLKQTDALLYPPDDDGV